jgi:dihydroneopterin aldolase
MDRIFLRDLCLACTIGVSDRERAIRQMVKIDLDLEVDLREAGARDDLALTVDYKVVRDRLERIVTESGFFLVEALAHRIADECLSLPRVKAVHVRLEKPGALRATRAVGVEIFRSSA